MKVETVWVCLLCVCEKNKAKRKQQTKRLKTQICFVVVDNRKRLTKINDFITLKSQSIYELSITTLKIRKEKIFYNNNNK